MVNNASERLWSLRTTSLRLTSRSEAFAGKKYSTLDEEDQNKFLSYTISVEPTF